MFTESRAATASGLTNIDTGSEKFRIRFHLESNLKQQPPHIRGCEVNGLTIYYCDQNLINDSDFLVYMVW